MSAAIINFEPWMEQAICAQCDPDAWFPEKGQPVEEARRVCRGCPVRIDCLDYALVHGERGIWGGMTEYQRRQLKPGRNAYQDCAWCRDPFIPSGPGQICCSRACAARYRNRRSA